jgi:phosphopantothenoylcysteine decarboxylase
VKTVQFVFVITSEQLNETTMDIRMNNNTTIALGITGSIAAYKAADLCSRLTKNGFDVNVLMTESAGRLVGEQTFFTLSRNPVISSLWNLPEWQPGHIALAERAALLVVAPCTANFIGKYTHGIADDALTTYALSHPGPVILAPAMNPVMWQNSAVQDNVALLKKRGTCFVGPGEGNVACGTSGVGRMSEPEEIIIKINEIIAHIKAI